MNPTTHTLRMASRATKNFMLGGALVGFVGIVYNFTYSKMKTVRRQWVE